MANSLGLIDRLFAKYPRPDSFREAVRAAWDFRGRSYRLLKVSPEALEAAVRVMVCSVDSGVALRERARILQRYLSCWGLDDGAAEAHADEQLLMVGGPQLSDEEVLLHFTLARAVYITTVKNRPATAEAREWLKSNPNQTGLATNKFHQPGLAAVFVEALYSAGATRVTIDNICYDYEQREGGPMADSMSVDLPDDAESRSRIFALCNEHCMADSSTGAAFADAGQSTLRLWWD